MQTFADHWFERGARLVTPLPRSVYSAALIRHRMIATGERITADRSAFWKVTRRGADRVSKSLEYWMNYPKGHGV